MTWKTMVKALWIVKKVKADNWNIKAEVYLEEGGVWPINIEWFIKSSSLPVDVTKLIVIIRGNSGWMKKL